MDLVEGPPRTDEITGLGYDVALDVPESDNIKIGSVGFDSSGIYPKRFRKTDGVWRSQITTVQLGLKPGDREMVVD